MFTSQDTKLLFLNDSNYLQIHDYDSLEPSKILKAGPAIIRAVDKLKEDIFILGCSHGKLSVFDEAYARVKQSFEAHNDSISALIVNAAKVV